MLTRLELVSGRRTTPGWSGLKDQQNKTDKFLSVSGAMHVIVNSWKGKGKEIKEHILREIVQRGFYARIEERQEQHRQTITGRDNQVQAIQHGNVVLQAQRDVYQARLQRCQDQICDLITNCHVLRANDFGKDNIIIIVWKHTTPANDKYHNLPYYVTKIQRRKRYVKLRWFRAQYPHHRFKIEELDNANIIHAFNRFEEEGHVQRFQCHFRLADLACDVLYGLATPTIHD